MMRRMTTRVVLIAIVLAIVVACGGDDGPGPHEQRTEQIPLGNATALQLSATMHAGALTIDGGGEELIDAELEYFERLNPEITVSTAGNRGTVVVSQPEPEDDWEIDTLQGTSWTQLHLFDGIIADVSVSAPAAQTEIDLDTVRLQSFAGSFGSRFASVALDGDQPDLRSIDIDGATAEVWLNMEGTYAEIPTFDVSTTSGGVTFVGLGEWTEDVSATFRSESGKVAIHVPEGVRVEVDVATAGGEVVVHRFTQQGSVWASDAGDPEQPLLRLRVETTTGDVTLRVEDDDAGA